jgi:periplasmic divalent cation tolerance protein
MSVSEKPPEYLQVTTTLERREDAERIANDALASGLAACARIEGPFQSRYQWKGALETADEWACVLKTTASAYGRLEQCIAAIHPYETPEIIALPIVAGSSAYLRWIDSVVRAE